MSRETIVGWFAALLLSAWIGGGCVGPAASDPASGGTQVADGAAMLIRVALLPITDGVPFYVAAAEGYFEQEGVDTALIPVSSGAERDTLLQTGEADCALTDLHGVALVNASNGATLKVITTARQATPEQPVFFLIASPESGVQIPTDLTDRAIGISENTIIDYWLDRMLAFANVDGATVERANVPQIPVRLELLHNGQLDAAVLPDPLASLAQLQGAAVVLDDRANPAIAVSVIACRQEVIDADRTAISALLAGWDQAVADINADPARFRNVLIENTRVPEPLQDQYDLPAFPTAAVPTEAQVADVIDWLMDKGLIDGALTYAEMVDGTLR